MANWCQGSLRVRARKDDLLNFICSVCDKDDIKIISHGDHFEEIQVDDGWYWLDGMHRASIYIDYINIDLHSNFQYAVFEFKQAWRVDAMDLLSLARSYGFDIRIYAFEWGQQFNQNIEIIDGHITIDDTITFDNYDWECICPNIGG